MANSCLQYVYPNSKLAEKYNINCENNKHYDNYNDLNTFNNKQFLENIKKNYETSFENDDSPFIFKNTYITEKNNALCNNQEFSLKPQQKFLGQMISPETNIKNSLIFHGLGSGKTCTSLVIGESLKTEKKNLIYVIPAALEAQYYEEIVGEIKKGKLISCTSQCILHHGSQKYYEKLDEINLLKEKLEEELKEKLEEELKEKTEEELKEKLEEELKEKTEEELKEKTEEELKEKKKLKTEKKIKKLQKNIKLKEIELDTLYPGDKSFSNSDEQPLLNKLYDNLEDEQKKLKSDESLAHDDKKIAQIQNEIKKIKNQINIQIKLIQSKVTKVFTIISHITFINGLFSAGKKINYGNNLIDPNFLLYHKDSLLVIDEIQRLISENGILYKKLFAAVHQYFSNDIRIILLTATPIYDNPYELALTMNLLKPRIMFPLDKSKFYSFFLGEKDENGNDKRITEKNWIKDNSELINKNLLNYMCSGYVSYFKGGNPNAYPNKRIIELKHIMGNKQMTEYISALKSDLEKDNNNYSKKYDSDEFIFNNDIDSNNDEITGIYVNSLQFSNIGLTYGQTVKSDQTKTTISFDTSLNEFRTELKNIKSNSSPEVLTYIREKGYSEKFAKIIELSLSCNGPVFIFSNYLAFGVKPLSYILDACGLTQYPKEDNGYGRYFIWSSETSIDKDLTTQAKKIYNSPENINGNKLKIILGTRSVMEGVSFKNVKQVHITDPWWNEARIEQILARAVRFCSHSLLPLEEQYTDIYKHYSVLPSQPNQRIQEVLKEIFGKENHKDFENLSIQEKMVLSSQKKLKINIQFENILKESSYDCQLNQNGNIIRLEEVIKSISYDVFQILYKHPNTLKYYIREGIPETINFIDIINRTYSYPNNKTFPVIFYLAKKDDSKFIKDPIGEILNKETHNIDDNLNLLENINCWNESTVFNQINMDKDIKDYLIRITNNYSVHIKNPVIELIKTKILLKTIPTANSIKYVFNKDYIIEKKLIKCLECLKDKVDNKMQKKIISFLESDSTTNKKLQIIEQLIKNNNFFNEMEEELLLLDLYELNTLLKESES